MNRSRLSGCCAIILKSFRDFAGDRAKISVNLRCRRAEDEVTDGSLGELDILVAAEDVNFAISQHNASLRDVLDGELGSSSFASKSTCIEDKRLSNDDGSQE